MSGHESAEHRRLIGGRYRVDFVLGRGGMGTVWAGTDELLGRPAAVKEVLPPAGLSADDLAQLRERTMQEARAAARLSSPAALTVHDVVEEDGRPWIVMERLAPHSLDDVLRERGRLPAGEVAALGLTMLNALDAAHAAGVLHRDVKPANVMFRGEDDSSHAVLTDFGIARFVGDPTVTATGMLVGSPAYVAPERARGEAASTASDLWSLGVTLWTAVEGHSPFHRDGSLPTLTAVVTEEVPQAEHAGELAPALDGLLRKDPDERLTSPQVRGLLQDAASGRRPAAASAAEPSTATSVLPVIVPGASGPTESAPPAPTPATDPRPTPTPAAVPTPTPTSTPDPTPTSTPDPAPAPDAAPRPRPTPIPAAATGRDQRRAEQAPPRRSRSGPLLAVLAVVVLLAGLVAALAFQRFGDDGEASDPQNTPGTAASPEPTDPPSSSADPQGTDDPPATSEPPATSDPPATTDPPATSEPPATTDPPATDGDGDGDGDGDEGDAAPDTPEGFERYADETGFSVAVPAGWQASREEGRVYLRDPDSPAFLLVDQTDDPRDDPVQDWENQEASVSQRLDEYELIRIDPLELRGWQGADWEFIHGSGEPLHVLNRNLITAPDQAYALYWSVPDSAWEENLAVFEQISQSFQPDD